MKKPSEVVFSLTRQQLRLLIDPERKTNTIGPDSRFVLERRGLLARTGNGWHRTGSADKLLRVLAQMGVDART